MLAQKMYVSPMARTMFPFSQGETMFERHTGTGATAVLGELDHTADVALRITAATPADLFVGAALGMARIMTGGALDAGELPADEKAELKIELEDADLEGLLVGWLNALLALYDTDLFLPSRIALTLAPPARLTAEVRGVRGPRARVLVKAATFHMLAVQCAQEGWAATVVFDV